MPYRLQTRRGETSLRQHDDISVRPFGTGDFEPLAEVVCQTWGSGQGEALDTLGARLMLAEYLVEHDWGLVAYAGDTLVGGVLACLRDTPADAHWEATRASLVEQARSIDPTLPQRLHELGEVEVREAEEMERLRQSGTAMADATILLLVLSPEARGHHLGSRLLEAATSWAAKQGARGYFLMTDDECDVGFYDHLGIPRIGSVEIEHEGRPFGIYTYGKLFA